MPDAPLPLSPAVVLALPADQRLDVLVSAHVLGHIWNGGNPMAGFDGRWPWPWPVSTDERAAVTVIDALAARGVYLSVQRTPDGYWCRCSRLHGNCFVLLTMDVAVAPTLALAVARCALLCAPHLTPPATPPGSPAPPSAPAG